MKKYRIIKKVTLLSCLFMTFIFMLQSKQINGYAAENSGTTATAYHKHAGSSQGGGCYGTPAYCGGRMEERSENPHGCGISASGGGCAHCGCWYEPPSSKYPSGCAHCNCPKPTVTRCVICGQEGGSGYCSKIAGYSLNCGKSEGVPLASISLGKSTEEWAKEVILEASYQILSPDIAVGTCPYNWNDQGASEKNQYSVTENGTYTCLLNIEDSAKIQQAKASVTINHIDKKAPNIKIEEFDNHIFVKEQILTITAQDIQEDNSPGAGLHQKAYSFDGGQTWQESNSFTACENREYLIQVRDSLENTSQQELVISNIDTTPPKMNVEKNGDIVSITAEDLQEDGTKGSGLHELPYSYDGKKTWTHLNTYEIKTPGEYTLLTRDVLENIASAQIKKEESKTENKEPESSETENKEPESTEPESTDMLETDTSTNLPNNQIKPTEENSTEPNPTEENRAEETQTIVRKEIKKVLTEKPGELVGSEPKKMTAIHAKAVKAIAVTAVTAAGICVLFLLFYAWFFLARIYGVTDKNTRRLIGISLIRREEEYCIYLSESIIERSESVFVKIKMNTFFIKRHRLEKLLIIMQESKIVREITDEISLRLNAEGNNN